MMTKAKLAKLWSILQKAAFCTVVFCVVATVFPQQLLAPPHVLTSAGILTMFALIFVAGLCLETLPSKQEDTVDD